VIDFIDMEIRDNRDKVGSALRSALARDKTAPRSSTSPSWACGDDPQEGLEGLIESMSTTCEVCGGEGSSSTTREP